MMVSSRVDQKLALAPEVDTIKWLLVMLNDDMSHGPRTPVKRHNDGLGDDPPNGQPDVDDPDKDTTDKLNDLIKGSRQGVVVAVQAVIHGEVTER